MAAPGTGLPCTLNLGAFVIGIATRPGGTFRAFVRGRRGGNLYRFAYSDTLLDTSVVAARERLAIPTDAPKPTQTDVLNFCGWSAIAFLWVVLAPLSALVFVASLYARPPAGDAWSC